MTDDQRRFMNAAQIAQGQKRYPNEADGERMSITRSETTVVKLDLGGGKTAQLVLVDGAVAAKGALPITFTNVNAISGISIDEARVVHDALGQLLAEHDMLTKKPHKDTGPAAGPYR